MVDFYPEARTDHLLDCIWMNLLDCITVTTAWHNALPLFNRAASRFPFLQTEDFLTVRFPTNRADTALWRRLTYPDGTLRLS